MKKYILVILSLITAIALLPIKATAVFAAESETETIETGIFLPTSYLQYYKLDNPYAICRYTDDEGKEVVAISHTNGIVIYRDEKFKTIDLNLGNAQIKKIDHYGKYLVYFFGLRLYSVDMTDFNDKGWNAEDKKEKIGDNVWDFSISGDKIVIATDSYFSVYPIAIDENGLLISAEDDYEYRVNAERPSNILFADGAVYYTELGKDIFKYTIGDEKAVEVATVTNVQSIAEGEDDKIYYSCQSGVFTLNGETIKDTSNINETDKDLGKIYDPKGICLTDKGLWVVDSALNAVQEIDLSDNSFTKFAITTNSKAINRLSASVSDLCVDGDKIYALDDDRIVVINDINGVNTYNKIDLYGDEESFAVGGGYLCRYSGGHLSCYKIAAASERDDFSLDIDEICKVQASDVCDIAYLDGNFFVLAREPHHGKGYPLILALSVEKKTLSRLSGEETEESEPKKITADIFGNVYYAAEDDNEYKFYQLGVTEPLYKRAKNGETLIKLQTDMDGKLYALYSGNKVECYAGGGEVFSKTLILSDNLTGMDENPVVSMCLSYNSETAYFLFKGLILKSTSDMDIATPGRILVPDGFSIGYKADTEYARLKENSKAFSVTEEFEKYFGYTEMTVCAPCDYAVFEINGKYSLVVSNGVRAIVRNADVDETTKFALETVETQYKYAAVDFNAYAVPTEENAYRSASAIKHEKLLVLGEITFNGVEYYAVETASGSGYIRKKFLLSEIVKDKFSEEVRSGYLYLKTGASVWENGDLSGESELLSAKTKVKIISSDGDVIMIEYDGKIMYTSSEYIYSDGRQKTTKALAVLLCALSLTAFALFFEKRYLYGRGGNV